MSYRPSADIAIGCFVTFGFADGLVEDLLEKAHMEDRYDPKTGKKVKPVKVIDVEGGEVIVFEGEHYDHEDVCSLSDLAEAIARKIKCRVRVFITDNNDFLAVFEPVRGAHFNKSLAVFASDLKELRRIHTELKKLGLEVSKPRVSAVLDYD